MPLRKAPLPLQFSGGVELRQDAKQVPITKLIDLQNAVFTRQTSLVKRNGYRALGVQIANARGLAAARDGEILRFTDHASESYRPSSNTWVDAGEVAATTATTLPTARTGTYQTQPDIADRLGVRVMAWEDSRGGVWCSVLEASTGRILLSQTQLDSNALAKSPRCVSSGDILLVLWTRSDTTSIRVALINPVSPTVAPTVSTLTADLSGAVPFFDAESVPSGPAGTINLRPAIIAWAQSGGGIRVAWIAASGALGGGLSGLPSPATFGGDTTTGPIAVTWDPVAATVAYLWVVAATSVAVRFVTGANLGTTIRTATALGATTGAFTRLTAGFGATGLDGTSALYWAAELGTTRSDLTTIDSGSALQTLTTLDATSTRLRGHGLVSRAWHDGATLTGGTFDSATSSFVIDGDVYVMVARTVRFFPYVAALRLSDSSGINSPGNTIVARLMPGEASGSLMRTTGAGTRAWTQALPSVIPIDLDDANVYSRQHAVPVPYRIQLSSQNGDQFSEQGLKLATLDFNPLYQTVQFGRGLYLASAAPMHYDGEAWREADFHCAPDFGFDAAGAPVDLATSVTIDGAGAIPNGTYLYAYWCEAVDAQGELHRGPVSVKVLATMTGGPKKFSLAIPTCRLTRFANARICAARSVQGATGTDSTLPLYKITSNDVTVTTGDNCYVVNDPTVDTVTLLDNLTDAQLITREPLYTNGGILSNDPAPWSGAVIATGKNRLLWTDTTDPSLVRFSQLLEDDTALQAPIGLSLAVDAFGGPISAIGVLDDAVIAFKETAIFAFGGPGPLADPSVDPGSNIFTSAERVTSDVGCVSASSIGDTPLGITFQSSKGIKLLARGRQVVDIGNPVEPLAQQHFTRTTLLPDRKAILYLTDEDGGFSLYWDYDRNQWSKFSNHLGLDAIVVDGVYHYLRADGLLYQETIGSYLDDTVPIGLRIETAWIHFAQYLQGWQKILWAYWLGEYVSSHDLAVRYRLDYNTGYSPVITSAVDSNFNPSMFGNGNFGNGSFGGVFGGGSRYQRRIHLNRRCQSISFLIEDRETGGVIAPTGASFELSELLLIGGGVGPDFKVGAARSA